MVQDDQTNSWGYSASLYFSLWLPCSFFYPGNMFLRFFLGFCTLLISGMSLTSTVPEKFRSWYPWASPKQLSPSHVHFRFPLQRLVPPAECEHLTWKEKWHPGTLARKYQLPCSTILGRGHEVPKPGERPGSKTRSPPFNVWPCLKLNKSSLQHVTLFNS